jgi:hypothetical protein
MLASITTSLQVTGHLSPSHPPGSITKLADSGLTARSDAFFELTDAVLCADGPVTSLVELTLTAEHRRGHGACTTR